MSVGRRPRVVVLQKYVAPYRVSLFEAIAAIGSIDLTVLCYGVPERRRGNAVAEGTFATEHARGISLPMGYEANVDLPFGLPRALARLAPDVVVCAPDWGGLAALRYARSNGARLVVWSEATAITEANASRAKAALRRFLYRRAAAFLVPGALAKNYIESLDGRAGFVEMKNTVDPAAFRVARAVFDAKYSEEAPRTFTFSGSLVERKGVRLLLDAFVRAKACAESAGENAVLRLAGRGPLARELVARSDVSLLGFLTGERYRECIRGTHVLVLPSLWDCNPLVVVEALQAGASLIVSDGVGSFPETVRGNGTVVARGDIDALTDAVVATMRAPIETLAAQGRRSLEIAREFEPACAARAFVDAVRAI